MLKSPTELVNQAKQIVREIEWEAGIDEHTLIIDIREPAETDQGMIPNSINIPRGLIEFEIFANQYVKRVLDNTDQPQNVPVLLYCKSGARSALAAQSLHELGFKQVVSLSGGYDKWVTTNS